MNRYPLWKNLFVSASWRSRRCSPCRTCSATTRPCTSRERTAVAVDDATLAQITKTLTDGNVPYIGAALDDKAAVIRFETTGDQLRGNEILAKAMPNNVVALSLASRTPKFLQAVGLKPMALGLDLRGGVQFLYQVDLASAIRQYLTTYESDLRTGLREANIRNDLRVLNDGLQVSVVEPGDLARAEEIIRRLDTGDQLIQLGKLANRSRSSPRRWKGARASS